MINSRYVILGIIASLCACGDPEPKFWEKEDYIARDKPEGVEYLYCGYASTLLEVFPDQLRAIAYEYGSTETFASHRTDYEELPDPNFLEFQTELNKRSADSVRYTQQEVAWKGVVQRCGEATLWSDTYFGPGGEGYKGHLVFERRFADLNLLFKDRRECTDYALELIQTDLNEKAYMKNKKFGETISSCKFMPDTHSFNIERQVLQEKFAELARESKERSLSKIEAKERKEEERTKAEQEAGANRI